MTFPVGPFVVWACTLAGGFRNSTGGTGDGSCDKGPLQFPECAALDGQFGSSLAASWPWIATLGTILVLGMPTVLLGSARQSHGVRDLCDMLFECLVLMLMCSLATQPSVGFTWSLHSCTRMLSTLQVSNALVGGAGWWSLRYLVILGMLGFVALNGPAVSVIPWPGGTDSLHCAHIAHLGGCMMPELILFFLRWVTWAVLHAHPI